MKISLWLFFLFGRDTVLRRTAAAKPVYNNPLSYEKDALKDFSQIYVATKDLSGSATKAIGAPSVILEAISKRLASYLPKTRQVGAGCRIPSNDIVGPAAFGGYDLLLAPDRALGQCITPSDKSPMLWRGAIPDRESYERSKNLPAAEDVFEAVFERKGPQARVGNDEVNLSFWFVSFVNWFHDDNFRTEQGSDGTYNWSDKVGLRMSQVYGHTSERQQALRAFSNGKMKTQTLGKWAYFPPSLQSIQAEYPGFDMWTPETGPVGSSAAADKTDADVDTALFFAIGDPRFNMHPGHLMWATIALYLHNQACDAILGSNPEFNDEEVFQRARAIVFHLVQTTRLNDFISDSVSHTRDHFSIPYDPPTLREDIGRFLNFKGGIPNYLEFNHIYHAWHSFIPDALEIDGETVSMRQLMWKPELFHATPLSKIAAGFTKTPVAKYGPHSFLPFLRDITVQALKDERSQRMPGYNSYRANFGLEPLTSFDQLGVDDPDAVAGLYANNIDNLELLPGVLADNQATIPGNLLGDIQLVMVTLLAVEDLVSDEILSNPVLWSEDYLTKGGFEFLQRYNFADVLGLILDGAMPTPACPFRSSDKGCAPEEEWVDFDKTLHCFMCMSSVCSYIGLDLTEWFFDDNGYMRSLAASLTIAAAIMCVMYTTLFAIIQRLIPQEEKDENRKYVSPMTKVVWCRMVTFGVSDDVRTIRRLTQ
jgi:prostaglandin-endoperoxide synthase 2